MVGFLLFLSSLLPHPEMKVAVWGRKRMGAPCSLPWKLRECRITSPTHSSFTKHLLDHLYSLLNVSQVDQTYLLCFLNLIQILHFMRGPTEALQFWVWEEESWAPQPLPQVLGMSLCMTEIVKERERVRGENERERERTLSKD